MQTIMCDIIFNKMKNHKRNKSISIRCDIWNSYYKEIRDTVLILFNIQSREQGIRERYHYIHSDIWYNFFSCSPSDPIIIFILLLNGCSESEMSFYSFNINVFDIFLNY